LLAALFASFTNGSVANPICFGNQTASLLLLNIFPLVFISGASPLIFAFISGVSFIHCCLVVGLWTRRVFVFHQIVSVDPKLIISFASN
jgi:hypothetical protein